MEQKNKNKEKSLKAVLPWKTFFKDQLFLIIVGIIAFITYLLIFFLKKDWVYFYLSIGVLGGIAFWVLIEGVIMVFKEKKKLSLKIEESVE